MSDKKVEIQSPKYKLNSTDLKKISRGFLLSISGVAIDMIANLIFQIDFGPYTELVYVVTPVLVNTIRKIIKC